MGRPSKYNSETIPRTLDYINDYEQYGQIIPTAEGLACVLEVSRSTLYYWAEKEKDFSDILGRLNAAQVEIAIRKGLENKWNATIVKLLLAKQGYSDRQEITGADGKELQITYQIVRPDASNSTG